MKKIGTITFHVAHNYGAMLQAYALPKAVETLGYQSEIIHYCFPHIYSWGHVEYLPELCKRHGVIGGLLRFVKRFVQGAYRSNLKKIKFEKFIYRVMPISTKTYHSVSELQNMDYDAILFGSDQIWNSQLTGGLAPEFVGDFKCLEKTKKIAYAASCGRPYFLAEEKDRYYPHLQSFAALGIRENGLCKSLSDDGFAATVVLDPTLLLTKTQWNEVIKHGKHRVKLPKKDYLLVYAFDENPKIYSFIDQIADKHGLDVCVISYNRKAETEKYHVYDNCGPEDFLALIAGASRVVTTSFHGTVFSIIFERQFYCVPHPTLHERTDSLLSLLELDERNMTNISEIPTVSDIDWSHVNILLEKHRDESLRFLKEAIG